MRWLVGSVDGTPAGNECKGLFTDVSIIPLDHVKEWLTGHGWRGWAENRASHCTVVGPVVEDASAVHGPR